MAFLSWLFLCGLLLVALVLVKTVAASRHRNAFRHNELRSFEEDLMVLEGLPSFRHHHGFLTVQQQLLVLQRMQREYSFLSNSGRFESTYMPLA